MRCLILVVMATSISLFTHAEVKNRPIFIRARCNGKLSAIVLTALKDAVKSSPKYQLVDGLDDNGLLDTVQTIYMTCAENNQVTAVASQFGIAKCQGPKVCQSAIDGLSLNVALCNANLSADCGRALFKAFDAYVNRPDQTPLKIE
jgi:hypothetical protein